MQGICKSFSGVQVLDSVQLEVRAGEVHILAGENGAGKSTLIKILGGVHSEYEGNIWIKDQPVHFRSPQNATESGVAVIHQELSLIGCLSVAENIYLGRESAGRGGVLHQRQERRNCIQLLRQFELDISPNLRVENLALSSQQMIEIAKAASLNAQILVMDEPTSALTEVEVAKLFDLIQNLKARGCAIIYISHKMEEIYRIADRITVLRDGKYIGTATAADLPVNRLIQWMIGRELNQQFPASPAIATKERLIVENLGVRDSAGRDVVKHASFSVNSGEIVGFAGLQGAGNTELFHAIFGAYGRGRVRGKVFLDGKPMQFKSTRKTIRSGFALLTNDRKESGLVLCARIRDNITLASLRRYSPGTWIRSKQERQRAKELADSLRVKCVSIEQEVQYLSGGNQQKVVLAKWLDTQPKVLLLDDPTRGVDIGAKHEIYDLMMKLKEQGVAILLISSEMPEMLALADRIYSMHRGEITDEFTRENATQEKILAAAMGITGPQQQIA
jgi:ABC-type sugar transport system ATPase subunit